MTIFQTHALFGELGRGKQIFTLFTRMFMKKYLVGCLMLFAVAAQAQTYKPFKVNVSVGYAQPLHAGNSGGVLFAVEPKYGVTDHFDLGFRLELASVARGVVVNGNTTTGDVGAFASYLLTANYLFGEGNARPFIGGGLGAYTIGSGGTVVITNGQTPQNVNLVSDTKFGGMVRAGVKVGHFVAAVEYNAAPTTELANISNTKISSENAYLGIKVGADFGGGRR